MTERTGGVTGERSGTRERLLAAATAVAREVGPANLSLDAVAARAGVSKGGLLYHFPTKARLLEALVEGFLGGVDAALRAAEADGRPNAAAAAYLVAMARLGRREERPDRHPDRRPDCARSAGLLAALAEDPGLLDPVRDHECDFLARIRANASDPELATLVFLVAHGIRNLDLLAIPALGRREIEAVLDQLAERLDAGAAGEPDDTRAAGRRS